MGNFLFDEEAIRKMTLSIAEMKQLVDSGAVTDETLAALLVDLIMRPECRGDVVRFVSSMLDKQLRQDAML